MEGRRPGLIPILTPDAAAAWDRAAEAQGVAVATLMDAAGRAAATVIAQRAPAALARGVLVACGAGHNGGDGWVVARALRTAGARVTVAPLPGPRSALTAQMALLAERDGVAVVEPDGPWPAVGLLVDAILGTGAKGPPRADARHLLDRLHDLALPLVALDGPTGLDLLHGTVHGVAHADLSITFGGVRRGHLLARDEVGDVVVVDIGLPLPAPAGAAQLVDTSFAAQAQRVLAANAHKGTRGRVVVVGGDERMTGAARMTARAAFAAGAGLVHLAAPEAALAVVRVADPDVQVVAQPFDGPLHVDTAALLQRADVVVVGPGLGRGEGRTHFVLAVLAAARAAVVDADALVALAGALPALRAHAARIPLVLTPHAGELRTLVPEAAAVRETDPWAAAAHAAAETGATVLLKGVPTVIASASGAALTVAAGNPGLATGGSGDVLSGLIGAAMAHGMEPQVAAAIGAQALGEAADLAARRHTARGMRPLDVIAACEDVWRHWARHRDAPPPPRPPILLELARPIAT